MLYTVGTKLGIVSRFCHSGKVGERGKKYLTSEISHAFLTDVIG